MSGEARGQRPEGDQREPPARRTAGLESLLPLAIIVRLHLATEPTIERVELFSKLLVRCVIRLGGNVAQQLVEIAERVPDPVPPLDELRSAERSSQVRTGKRVV